MDAMSEGREPGAPKEQSGRTDIDESMETWNSAPTERHLGEGRPETVERATGQPYTPEQPYTQPYAPNQYGRGVDPSLPLGMGQGGERNAWRGGQEGERRRVSVWVPVVGGCLVAIAAVMVLCAVASGIVFGLARNGGTATDTQTRMLTVNGPATLTIHASAANVWVIPGNTGQVTAVLHKEARAISRDRAQRALDGITLDVTQSGNSLTLAVDEPSFNAIDFFSHSVDLTITTPAMTGLDATLDAGNLNVRGLTGALTANLVAGNLTVDDMTIADHATLRVQAGNVEANRVTGAVAATVNFGNVTLSEATLTENSTMRVDAGNVSFDGSLHSGASLNVTDNAGNISVTLPHQTDAHLNATANAGKITITGWSGISQISEGAKTTAMGDLSAHPTGMVTLHVDAGNITMRGE